MLKSPATLHRVHKFRHDNRLYIADLERFRLLEVNEVAWDAMVLSSTLDTETLGELQELPRRFNQRLRRLGVSEILGYNNVSCDFLYT